MRISTTVVLLTIIGLIASCNGLPAMQRMIYYRQPQSWYSAPQRLMYLQYQQVQPAKLHARSTQSAATLVAGDSVATGTYLKESVAPNEDLQNDVGANSGQSIAEAYPSYQDSNDNPTYTYDQPASNVDNVIPILDEQQSDSKIPKEYDFEKSTESSITLKPDTADDEIQPTEIVVKPAVAPVIPTVIAPSKQYLPSKKKIYVELEEENEDEDLDEETTVDEYEPIPEQHPARAPDNRRPVKPKAKGSSKPKPSLPVGTFFPINFGGTSGGAIAIANSFSTGEGGSATSHATAYGSPEAARSRYRITKRQPINSQRYQAY